MQEITSPLNEIEVEEVEKKIRSDYFDKSKIKQIWHASSHCQHASVGKC